MMIKGVDKMNEEIELDERGKPIPKVVAAREVYNEARMATHIGVMGITGVLVGFAAYTFHPMAGGAAAAIVCGTIGVFVARQVRKMKYLEEKYKLR